MIETLHQHGGATALCLLSAYAFLAVVVRSLVQRKLTGAFGFHGVSGKFGSGEWLGGFLFVVACVGLVTSPLMNVAGLPVVVLRGSPLITCTGIVLSLLGLAGTLLAQTNMGASWRIGVDRAERTTLVTDGVFAYVRNPIFSSMLVFGFGLALVLPDAMMVAAALLLLLAVEMQVRLVEEPYLLETHPKEYAAYAARVGRFVPGLGRIR